jgi:hypothetical protein
MQSFEIKAEFCSRKKLSVNGKYVTPMVDDGPA